MVPYLPGTGTLLNVTTVLVGGLIGMAVGGRLPERTRNVVTDCLGLITILMAVDAAVAVTDESFGAASGPLSPVLIVLGGLVIGAVIGSLLRIEDRLENSADTVYGLLARVGSRKRAREAAPVGSGRADRSGVGEDSAPDTSGAREHAGDGGAPSPQDEPGNDARRRFIDGWLTTTLLFCVGPLTILGSLSDGMGQGYDQLAVKSVLDGFAALAFASTHGAGVLASAGSVLVIQGALTAVGWFLGTTMPAAHIAALTATGGLILGALALRLLRIRSIPVGDLLPALVVAPLLLQLVVLLT